ncbi:homeobox domain-containing protein [Pilaira anomala]|nr:homeobox domain-containing protein [Pilaira anomala]
MIDNKPKRKRISPDQFCLLTELFQQTDTPSHELRERLAKKLEMTNREVQVWFQNRRAKVNRARLQEQEHVKKVKFNYWSSSSSSASSSSLSSCSSSPSLLPHDLVFHPDVTPIDILATAAAYVQQWDEQERKKLELQQQQQQPKRKSWRPWL